ncbi:MAG: glycosyltransferase family 4 protein [Acidimicrobiales bacterium]
MIVVEQLRRPIPGGIGTHIRGLLKGLGECLFSEDAGEQAARLLGGPDSQLKVSLLASRPSRDGEPLDDLGFPIFTSRMPSRLLTRAWELGAVRAPRGIDLLQATSLAFPATRGAPLVVSVHDLMWRTVPETFPSRGRRWHERALRRALSQAAGFVVPSQETASSLVAAGAPLDAVEVVGEGGDHMPPPDLVGTARLLDVLGVDGEYVLSVGTLEPRKNLQRLFSAFGVARTKAAKDLSLVVVGPRGWGEMARPVPGVKLAGGVPAGILSGLYSRALCLAYVPLAEGFGLPVLEAMRFGTPVIASPMPSVSEGVLRVNPLDVDEIAGEILRIVLDPLLRSHLGDLARKSAAELTWAKVALRHLQAWRRFC